ncbi:MAG: hypothetical protein ABIQ73_24405 [Acidimicrobiales bacterium]
MLRELAQIGVDRIVFTAFEAGATDVDNVAAFVARMRGVLDDVSD